MLFAMRDLLDKQLIDREEEPMGRIDALVVELRNGEPPKLVELETGFVPLASRFGARAASIVEALHRRWSVRRSARYTIPFSAVIEVHRRHIKVDRAADDTPATDWERWLRRTVIGRIPGSGKP